MIHGFKDNKITTAEEWLIDYSLRTGNSIDINTDLLDTPIIFDGREVDAFILDIIDNKLVIQLALSLKEKFDDKSNRYETSYIRELINSNEFLSRFNPEFVKHIQITKVHTENYTTEDKLWLLSHEEVGRDASYFIKPTHKCHAFEMFKTIDLAAYSHALLNEIDACGWRLRSANSNQYYITDVGCVDYHGFVHSIYASNIDYGALLPACTIC